MKKKYILLIGLAVIIILYILYKAIFVHPKVEVSELKRGNLTTVIYATGTVSADSLATLRSEAGGIVKYIKPHEGSLVEKGELLLKTDQSDELLQLEQAKSDLKTAKIDFENAELNFNRIKKLYETKTVSQKQYDDAKQNYDISRLREEQAKIALDISKQRLDKTEIYAPFSGVIISVSARLGDNLTPNSECFQIVAPSSINVEGEVDEQDLAKIRTGQKCTLAFDAYPDQTFGGTLYRIVPKTDEATKTSTVYIKIKDKPENLNIGMTSTINIDAGTLKDVLLILRASIVREGTANYIFIANKEHLKKVKIEIGNNNSGKFTNLIKGNIKSGELLVTNPKENFTDGMRVETVK